MISIREIPHAPSRSPRSIDRLRRYSSEIIEQRVRWYLTYRLSSRDLVTIVVERGILLSHMTILRWVQCYVPEYVAALESIFGGAGEFLAHG